jgi:threonylcarbamoyladenosine tRNA methylthiotransferase MtaB
LVPKDFRIRISSIEPNLLSDEIINLTSESEKLCDHFHIPLQSASNSILNLMKRRYNIELYKNLIYKVIEKIPNVGVGVDVIVGTPGETEEEFLKTYDFLKDLPISYMHVFTYSERPGTQALNYSGKVNHDDKKLRSNILRTLSEKKKKEFYSSQVGKELNVLYEQNYKQEVMEGFSSNYVKVRRVLNFDLVNKFTNSKIVDAIDNYCVAETLDNKYSVVSTG